MNLVFNLFKNQFVYWAVEIFVNQLTNLPTSDSIHLSVSTIDSNILIYALRQKWS